LRGAILAERGDIAGKHRTDRGNSAPPASDTLRASESWGMRRNWHDRTRISAYTIPLPAFNAGKVCGRAATRVKLAVIGSDADVMRM
jgi:hypothetical protein